MAVANLNFDPETVAMMGSVCERRVAHPSGHLAKQQLKNKHSAAISPAASWRPSSMASAIPSDCCRWPWTALTLLRAIILTLRGGELPPGSAASGAALDHPERLTRGPGVRSTPGL
jgi:hypothetical protein